MNRIHWKSTARHDEIQVKEFDLEQTADVWIFLDLDRRVQAGSGEDASVEVAIRAAASIADRSLTENRAVGLTAFGHRMSVLPADRGGRQHLKIMQLLAAVDADGSAPLMEGLVTGLARLRRGMTAVIITASLDRSWVRPLAGLRARGVATVILAVDAQSAAQVSANRYRAPGHGEAPVAPDPDVEAQTKALRHALAEHDLRTYRIVAGLSLSEQLAG